jgi:hypothetical protein
MHAIIQQHCIAHIKVPNDRPVLNELMMPIFCALARNASYRFATTPWGIMCVTDVERGKEVLECVRI